MLIRVLCHCLCACVRACLRVCMCVCSRQHYGNFNNRLRDTMMALRTRRLDLLRDNGASLSLCKFLVEYKIMFWSLTSFNFSGEPVQHPVTSILCGLRTNFGGLCLPPEILRKLFPQTMAILYPRRSFVIILRRLFYMQKRAKISCIPLGLQTTYVVIVTLRKLALTFRTATVNCNVYTCLRSVTPTSLISTLH